MDGSESRWKAYGSPLPQVRPGWTLEVLVGPSSLRGANGIAWSPNGSLCVTQVLAAQVTSIEVDSGRHTVYVPLGGGLWGADDLAFGPDGTLYATEPRLGQVSARSADGSFRPVCTDLPSANGLAIEPSSNRLFVDEFREEGRLLEIDPDGIEPPRTLLEGLSGPNALAVGSDGRLYFPQVYGGEVSAYDPRTGRASAVIRGLDHPTAVKFDQSGHLLVTCAGTGDLMRYHLASGMIEIIATGDRGVDNVCVSPDGRMFVSNYVNGLVSQVDGGGLQTISPGGFIGPFGLALLDDCLYFADGLSVGSIQAGSLNRLALGLIDLPGLAIHVAPTSDDGLAVLTTNGLLLEYDRMFSRYRVLTSGLRGPRSVHLVGEDLFVTEARGVARVNRRGDLSMLCPGIATPHGITSHGTDVVVSAGDSLHFLPSDSRDGYRLGGFQGLHGVASNGTSLLAADVAARQLVLVEPETGARTVLVDDAPIGVPHDTRIPMASSSVVSDGSGGFIIGCDGDGSIRRLALS